MKRKSVNPNFSMCVQPAFIIGTKNEDGSYLCEYDNYDFEYIIYPEGVIGEKEADKPELKDKVYIRAIKNGDEAEGILYCRYAQF